VSNLATRKDLAASTCDVFWYEPKCPVLFEIMVQITKEWTPGRRCASKRLLVRHVSRGWSQTNFVDLWSVSRPRFKLAEMAIEIWVMCELTGKLFETSSVR